MPFRAIHEECCRGRKETPQKLRDVFGKLRFPQGTVHHLNPAVACGLSNREWGVPHAQPGMASLLDVRGRAAKAIDQKIAQPLLGSLKIVRGIKRGENVILRNLPVERGDKTLESSGADGWVDLIFFHCLDRSAM